MVTQVWKNLDGSTCFDHHSQIHTFKHDFFSSVDLQPIEGKEKSSFNKKTMFYF